MPPQSRLPGGTVSHWGYGPQIIADLPKLPSGRRGLHSGSMTYRGPKMIGDVVSELMARSGFGRLQSAEAFDAAWREAAGPLTAKYSRVGRLRRGTLEVVVANSVLVQELGFQRRTY